MNILLTWLFGTNGRISTYRVEFHPFSNLFDEGDPGLCIVEPYFKSQATDWPVQGAYADRTAMVHQKISYEWTHPLGEVLSALLSAGIRLEYVHEFPFSVYPQFTFLEKGADGYYYLPGRATTIPRMVSIKGRLPSPAGRPASGARTRLPASGYLKVGIPEGGRGRWLG